jgi:hypothetical protein
MRKIFYLFIILLTCLPLRGALIREFGRIGKEFDRRKRTVLKKNTGQYRELSKNSTEDILILAKFYEVGKIINSFVFLHGDSRKMLESIAASQLDKLNYDFVIFKDILTDTVYYILREKLNNDIYGWGTYIFNPEYTYDVLIECPHPLFDWYSADIGINIFCRSNSKAFFMAGAHRFANSKKKGNLYGNSDAAHLKLSVFQAMHIAWCGSHTSTYQIHGFKSGKYDDEFPTDTDIVISSSDGVVTKEALILNKSFKKLSKENNFLLHSHVANELPRLSYANIAVNKKSLVSDNEKGRICDGERFRNLAAKDNRQGKYSNTYALSPFVHIEIGSDLRYLISVSPNIENIIISAVEKTIFATAYSRKTHPHNHTY